MIFVEHSDKHGELIRGAARAICIVSAGRMLQSNEFARLHRY